MEARPLHLLAVGVSWPPEPFLCRKFAGLADRGVRVVVAADRVRDPAFRLPGVEMLPPAGRRGVARAALALLMRSPRRLARLARAVRRVPPVLAKRHGGRLGVMRVCLPLARLRPDVVQFEWHVAAVDQLPLFDAWDCPVVTACRGADLNVYPHAPRLSAYADRLPEVMRRADAVHCVSEALRREAAAFGLEPHKARVILPGVDPALFHPAAREGPASQVLSVLMVSGLRWEKGFEYAFEAVRALDREGVPLRLDVVGAAPAGSDERRRALHTLADLGLEQRVRLVGGEPPAAVGRRLAQADVLLHASLTEGVPNAVLEAMACGVPVVTTDAGGVREVVDDGAEGFVVAARRPDALAAALRRLWADPDLRARMGAAGRERVLEGLTVQRQLDELMGLYEGLVAR